MEEIIITWGNSLKLKIEITENICRPVAAMDGWGNPINLEEFDIEYFSKPKY